MEKEYTINYGYCNGNVQYRYKVRVICTENQVKEIAKAIAKGERADFCYAEGVDYRVTISDTM